jgi:hypothetical protein
LLTARRLGATGIGKPRLIAEVELGRATGKGGRRNNSRATRQTRHDATSSMET